MRYKVKVRVPVEKRSLLGFKKTVMETKTIEVDKETYKKLKKEWEKRPYSIEEMMLYKSSFCWCIAKISSKRTYQDRPTFFPEIVP